MLFIGKDNVKLSQALESYPYLVGNIIERSIEEKERYQKVLLCIDSGGSLKRCLREIFGLSRNTLRLFHKMPYKPYQIIDYKVAIVHAFYPISINIDDLSSSFFSTEVIPLEYIGWFVDSFRGLFLRGSRGDNTAKLEALLNHCEKINIKDYCWFLVKFLNIDPVKSMSAKQAITRALYWQQNIDKIEILVDSLSSQKENKLIASPFCVVKTKSMVEILDNSSLINAHAYAMHHCAWLYNKRCQQGDTVIFSVKDTFNHETTYAFHVEESQSEYVGFNNECVSCSDNEEEITSLIKSGSVLYENDGVDKSVKGCQLMPNDAFSRFLPKLMPSKVVFLSF